MGWYVYFHRDMEGRIFYVGKGTGHRAWSRERHPAWHRYVDERLGGQFSVEILRGDLTDEQAQDLEAELISRYGSQLVNWINPGRQFDYEALERYHQLRNSNRAFVAETKPLEKSDPELAIVRYRQALERMLEYEGLTLERGLIADLDVGPNWGDPNILDRLTLCLQRIGRTNEAVAAAESYFARFPTALNLAAGRRIKARVDRLRSGQQPG
jgi:hypothetical protein